MLHVTSSHVKFSEHRWILEDNLKLRTFKRYSRYKDKAKVYNSVCIFVVVVQQIWICAPVMGLLYTKQKQMQICCTTKWFLWNVDNLSHLYNRTKLSQKVIRKTFHRWLGSVAFMSSIYWTSLNLMEDKLREDALLELGLAKKVSAVRFLA